VNEPPAQYETAGANTIVARNAVEDAYQALVEITGKPVSSLKALPDNFQPALPEARDAEAWVATAVENNPALRAQQLPKPGATGPGVAPAAPVTPPPAAKPPEQKP